MPALQNLATLIENTPLIPACSTIILFQEAERLKSSIEDKFPLSVEVTQKINSLFKALSKHSPCFHFDSSIYTDDNSLINKRYFEQKTQKVVTTLAQTLAVAVEENSLPSYFEKMLEFLGKNRNEIALEQQSKKIEEFGVLRSSLGIKNHELLTPLEYDNAYKEYRQKIIQSLLLIYRDSKEDLLENVQLSIISNPINDYCSEFSIQPLDKDSLKDKFRQSRLTPFEDRVISLLRILETSSPDEISAAPNSYPEIMEDSTIIPVYCSIVLKKRGRFIPLSSYFIFFNNKTLEQEEISSESNDFVVIFHQNVKIFKDSLKELEECFKDCINSTEEMELKKNTALFRYLFAHIAPYFRGSAWAAECAEKAIYQYKGYEFSYGEASSFDKRPLADLDALTALSISSFMEDYLSKVKLQKISKTPSTLEEGAV
ncbi:MAG: hypothetical protein JSS09_04225 [Verrucomicrobia bacterium]|nr:hypothetical protein [Verrucomicrobiota bacterium]